MRHGNRNAVERVFRKVKRRTSSSSNNFSHVQQTTVEAWLQAFAVWWNSLTMHDEILLDKFNAKIAVITVTILTLWTKSVYRHPR